MSDKHQDNRKFYDRISRAYDFMADSNEQKAREAGEQALELKEGEHVLEIGYGTGNTILNLADYVGADGQVCGVDISQGMHEVAQKKVDAKNLRNVELRVGDARMLPYDDESFDAAFASFTLELFPLDDIPKVLGELRRVLKRGGRIGIVSMAVVKEGEQPSALEKIYIWMHRHFPHIVDCQPIDLNKYVMEANFQINKEIEMSIWTMPVVAVIGKKV